MKKKELNQILQDREQELNDVREVNEYLVGRVKYLEKLVVDISPAVMSSGSSATHVLEDKQEEEELEKLYLEMYSSFLWVRRMAGEIQEIRSNIDRQLDILEETMKTKHSLWTKVMKRYFRE